MATLDILGRSFEIAPYKLGPLKRAARHIDAVNKAAAEGADIDSLEGLLAPVDDVIAVVSIGLVKIDPELTPEYLSEELGIEDLPKLSLAMRQILAESGMRSVGEAQAPSAPEPTEPTQEALPTTSET